MDRRGKRSGGWLNKIRVMMLDGDAIGQEFL